MSPIDSKPPSRVFAAPDIQEPEIAEVEACPRSGRLGTGPRVGQIRLRRREIRQAYDEALAYLPLGLSAAPEANTRHAFHLYTVMVDPERAGIERDVFLDRMNALGIGTGVHYQSVAEHPYYRERFGWHPDQWPNARKIGQQTVSLPMSSKLSDSDLARVAAAVGSALA